MLAAYRLGGLLDFGNHRTIFQGHPPIATAVRVSVVHVGWRAAGRLPVFSSEAPPVGADPDLNAYDSAIRELRDRKRSDGLEEYLAGHIISLAKQGERDPARLRSGALRALDSSMSADIAEREQHPTDAGYLRRVFASARQSASSIEKSVALVGESQALLERIERQLDRPAFVFRH